MFQRAAKSVSGFSGRRREKTQFRRRKQKSATKPLSFRRNAVLQKAAYSRIPFAATAFRLKEEQIPPLTNIPGEISLSPDAAAKAQTSVAKRHKTQRISLSPPRRKKTFSTNALTSAKSNPACYIKKITKSLHLKEQTCNTNFQYKDFYSTKV